MRVIYADEVFLLNLLVDYLLLLVTARLAGCAVKRRRIWAAAASGGLYAVAAAVGGRFLSSLAVKLLMGGLMAAVVFGVSARLARAALLFFSLSAAFAGAVMAGAMIRGEGLGSAYVGSVSPVSLLAAFAAFYALFTAAFSTLARRRFNGGTAPLTLTWGGRTVTVTALLDTGNTLRDPSGGLPVTVCALEAVEPLLPREAAAILRREPDASRALLALAGAGITGFFPVPYAAVGNPGGILAAFRPDGAALGGRAFPCAVAIDPAGAGQGQGYAAIAGTQ